MKAKIKLSRKGKRKVILRMSEKQCGLFCEIIGNTKLSDIEWFVKDRGLSVDASESDNFLDDLYHTLKYKGEE